jgi:pSer/pThr/pTyr-binding forkhead associated (FHA) protein
MTGIDSDQRHVDVTGERTSAFRADFSNEHDAAVGGGAEGQLFGVEGSALLVVKRGPNAGSRFLLDHATTTAGRHPNSDIFLDDVTVSRQHAQFRCVNAEFRVIDVGTPMSLCSPTTAFARTGGRAPGGSCRSTGNCSSARLYSQPPNFPSPIS